VTTLERSDPIASIHSDALRTTLSVADIVDYRYKIRVVTHPCSATAIARPRRDAGGPMSFAAAPTMSPISGRGVEKMMGLDLMRKEGPGCEGDWGAERTFAAGEVFRE
jgi:hypothetical protein